MNQTISRLRAAHDVGEGWTVDDAAELYEIARWGKGYFSIGGNGQVRIHPTKDASRSINLKQLVDDLQLRGIGLPTLIRFRDILQHRLKEIHDAFQTAIAQHEYSGRYVCVYPIKVNQQRQSAFHNGVARRLQPSDGRSHEGFALRRIANLINALR
jgi:arginine decarboxylase-like protein